VAVWLPRRQVVGLNRNARGQVPPGTSTYSLNDASSSGTWTPLGDKKSEVYPTGANYSGIAGRSARGR
jgi:hypothetical protein